MNSELREVEPVSRQNLRDSPEILYIGRSHFLNSRANLIQTLHMVQAFEACGCRTRLYLPARRGCNANALARLGDFGVSRELDLRFSTLLRSRWLFKVFIAIHRRELTPAATAYTRAPEVSIALSRAGVRHALEVHDISELREKKQLNQIIHHHRAGVLEQIFPISAAALHALQEEGADAERMSVAPSGVDTEAFRAVPPLDTARLDRPRVVYLGRISRDRGLGVLSTLVRSGEIDLTLVGDQDDHEAGPMRVVDFVPPREIPYWYAQSDLVLLPYQPELAHADSISPLKLFEAMASGRPLIASDLPTIREVIRHDENGLLVEPRDINAWTAAIRRLKSDRDLARRIALQARTDSAQYSWRTRAEKILAAIARG